MRGWDRGRSQRKNGYRPFGVDDLYLPVSRGGGESRRAGKKKKKSACELRPRKGAFGEYQKEKKREVTG